MAEEEEKTDEEIAQEEAQAAMDAAVAAMPPMPAGGGFPSARVGDNHVCPMVDVLKPHVGGPINPPGCPTVLIAGPPAARMGDMATCAGPPDAILKGSATVMIGNQPAARVMDSTAHGGMIIVGCFTVLIGG